MFEYVSLYIVLQTCNNHFACELGISVAIRHFDSSVDIFMSDCGSVWFFTLRKIMTGVIGSPWSP